MSIATATELWRMSATELAEAIRARQVSSVEVVDAHPRRIEAVNPSVNAVVLVLGDQALEAAKAADGALSAGADVRPLHGVPFTIKDNIDVAGTPTTQGFKALAQAYPTREERPLIVAPICTEPPFEAGTDLDDGRVAETIHTMRMAMAINTLGLPAVAVPVGIGDGLPQAMQVIGPRYREDLCLDAAASIEDRCGTITPIDPR